MRSAKYVAFAFGALAAAAIIAACGGSSTPGDTPAAQGQVPGVKDGDTENAPPAAAVEPTATQPPSYLLEGATPIPPAVPITGLDALLGVAPDDYAAAAMSEALLNEGHDLAGIELFVFPMPDGEHNLLVIDLDILLNLTEGEVSPVDEQALTSLSQGDFMLSLVSSQAYLDAAIGRVVLNLDIITTEGTLIFVSTLPAAAFEDMTLGVITQDEAQDQTLTEIRWVDPE